MTTIFIAWLRPPRWLENPYSRADFWQVWKEKKRENFWKFLWFGTVFWSASTRPETKCEFFLLPSLFPLFRLKFQSHKNFRRSDQKMCLKMLNFFLVEPVSVYFSIVTRWPKSPWPCSSRVSAGWFLSWVLDIILKNNFFKYF